MGARSETLVLLDASVVYAEGMARAFAHSVKQAHTFVPRDPREMKDWRYAYRRLLAVLVEQSENAQQLHARAVMGEALRAGGSP